MRGGSRKGGFQTCDKNQGGLFTLTAHSATVKHYIDYHNFPSRPHDHGPGMTYLLGRHM